MPEEKFMTTGYLPTGCGLIAQECVMRGELPGSAPEDDDKKTNGDLRFDAIAHLSPHVIAAKPEIEIEHLIKAGGLIAAEIDRHYRMFQAACNEITERDFGFACFDDMDAYDLGRLPWVGRDPAAFIKEHFAEDYESLIYQRDLEKQAEEAEAADDIKVIRRDSGIVAEVIVTCDDNEPLRITSQHYVPAGEKAEEFAIRDVRAALKELYQRKEAEAADQEGDDGEKE